MELSEAIAAAVSAGADILLPALWVVAAFIGALVSVLLLILALVDYFE